MYQSIDWRYMQYTSSPPTCIFRYLPNYLETPLNYENHDNHDDHDDHDDFDNNNSHIRS